MKWKIFNQPATRNESTSETKRGRNSKETENKTNLFFKKKTISEI